MPDPCLVRTPLPEMTPPRVRSLLRLTSRVPLLAIGAEDGHEPVVPPLPS